MNPQLFGPLMDRLHAAGALDVFYAAVQMKKNRPGTLVTVVARPDKRDELTSLLFAETTTIGVRYHEMSREWLEREVRRRRDADRPDSLQGGHARRPRAERLARVRRLRPRGRRPRTADQGCPGDGHQGLARRQVLKL